MPTKVCLIKAVVFPLVLYGCESWTMKKAEHQRTDAFELWSWRRLLRVPWTARRSSQSILKEISPGISLEGMMLKLKLQYFGHLMRRVDSLEKTLMLGGIGGRRRRGQRGWDGWMALPSQWTWVWVNSRSWWWTGRPSVLQFIGSQSQTRLSDWPELMTVLFPVFKGISSLFSIVAVLVCIPTNSKRVPFFSAPSSAYIVCRLLDSSHSDWHEMVPHLSFDLHFSDHEWC